MILSGRVPPEWVSAADDQLGKPGLLSLSVRETGPAHRQKLERVLVWVGRENTFQFGSC